MCSIATLVLLDYMTLIACMTDYPDVASSPRPPSTLGTRKGGREGGPGRGCPRGILLRQVQDLSPCRSNDTSSSTLSAILDQGRMWPLKSMKSPKNVAPLYTLTCCTCNYKVYKMAIARSISIDGGSRALALCVCQVCGECRNACIHTVIHACTRDDRLS